MYADANCISSHHSESVIFHFDVSLAYLPTSVSFTAWLLQALGKLIESSESLKFVLFHAVLARVGLGRGGH
jgi:hypothetical protein